MSFNDIRILEIDVNEFKNNIKKIKKYCGKGITIMPIIKANAYGTYINQNIDLIKDFEIVGVANSKEGEFLRKIGFENKIFILNQPYEEELETIFENDLIIGISSKEFVKEANKYNKLIKVHLEIETGMGRTGIFYDELDDFINSLGDNIKVEGIYTHFSCADTNIDYTEKTIEYF